MSTTHPVTTPALRRGVHSSTVWLTGVVAVGTLAVGLAALDSPELMRVMTRNLAQLRAGQWWRIITPVLVQPDGWGQLVFNLLGGVVVGAALERRTPHPHRSKRQTEGTRTGPVGGMSA